MDGKLKIFIAVVGAFVAALVIWCIFSRQQTLQRRGNPIKICALTDENAAGNRAELFLNE